MCNRLSGARWISVVQVQVGSFICGAKWSSPGLVSELHNGRGGAESARRAPEAAAVWSWTQTRQRWASMCVCVCVCVCVCMHVFIYMCLCDVHNWCVCLYLLYTSTDVMCVCCMYFISILCSHDHVCLWWECVGLVCVYMCAHVSVCWAIQWSWFARVNALCNLSRKKSREVTGTSGPILE